MARMANGAKWIGMSPATRRDAAPLMRRQFRVKEKARRAELVICGLGYYEAWINGVRVGDHVLDPAQTDYTERVMYVRHDVARLLGESENVLGVMLGDGWYHQNKVWAAAQLWYGAPCLWCELIIEYEDGREERVVSDGAWQCAAGPVIFNNVYVGEWYDARREERGWSEPGFRAAGWEPVVEVAGPGGRMEEQVMPPMRVTERLRPMGVREMGAGRYVVDFGQNFAGWVRIRVRGVAGREIRLRFAERVDEAGEIDTATTGVAATGVEQEDRYICKGAGVEEWEPRFTYHGFRYVEVSGWPGELRKEDIEGAVVHTDMRVVGGFECADERLNTLHRMAVWTHRSNVHSVPEDCPTRERCGWLGDAMMVVDYSLWNYDSRLVWEKYLDDIETTRKLHGGFPCNIAPGKRTCGIARADWALAFVLIPWSLYVRCGESEVLRRHWEGMERVMEELARRAEGWIVDDGFGDWCEPESPGYVKNTPVALSTSLWFYQAARVMRSVARVVGAARDARKYGEWAEQICAAIRERFYDGERRTFGSQTGNVLAVTFGVLDGEEAEGAVRWVVDDVRRRGMHVTTGIMGLRYIFEVLSKYGYGEVALAILHEDSYPSFGDMIRRGATTLWEGWGEREADKSQACSLNHAMKGGFDNWFYASLAGFGLREEAPGFREIDLRPRPAAGLEWVRAWHETRAGRWESAWRHEGEEFVWEVCVPEGCGARAEMPYSRRVIELGTGRHVLREVCEKGRTR